jgi:hypothetical protein
MPELERKRVSLGRFVEPLNEALNRPPADQDGMRFIGVGTGDDLLAPLLSLTDGKAHDKRVFERVALSYTIARP